MWLKYTQKQPPEVFYKKGVLGNFTEFTGKHPCQSLFSNKVAGLRPATLLKKSLWHRCFPVNFAKFIRTPFFTEHLWATGSLHRSCLVYLSSGKNWRGFETKYAWIFDIFRSSRPEGCSVKKLFLEIFQNAQENTLEKILCHRCFPVNFAKVLRMPFLTKHVRWLLLYFGTGEGRQENIYEFSGKVRNKCWYIQLRYQ